MNILLRVNDDDLEFGELDEMCHNNLPFTGISYLNYDNGTLRHEHPYVNGFREGICRDWYSNGQLKEEWKAIHGCISGKMTEWYENGKIKSIGDYEFGCELAFDEWDETGKLVV